MKLQLSETNNTKLYTLDIEMPHHDNILASTLLPKDYQKTFQCSPYDIAITQQKNNYYLFIHNTVGIASQGSWKTPYRFHIFELTQQQIAEIITSYHYNYWKLKFQSTITSNQFYYYEGSETKPKLIVKYNCPIENDYLTWPNGQQSGEFKLTQTIEEFLKTSKNFPIELNKQNIRNLKLKQLIDETN